MFNFLTNVSLTSWDEAWYGVISKNILNSGDIFNLTFNNTPFFDHPPFVMWLQAIFMKLFGVSEFSVRFPSLLLGVGTVVVLYLLCKELFGKYSGIFAGLTLISAPWFLTRSLSGNLDIPITFLFVLSFYLSLLSSKNDKFLIPLSVSLSFLFLTKSLVPFTIIPPAVLILWRKVKIKQLIYPTIIFLVLTLPWFVVNYQNNPNLIQRYLSIGYPGANAETDLIQNILLTKTYLHNGIGKIFVYGLFSIPIGLILFKKKYLPVTAFVGIFLLPFAFSNKGHIWHLIPLYPFWIMSFYGLLELILEKYKFKHIVKLFLLSIVFMSISLVQIKKDWFEIIKVSSYTSDIEILATKSKEYDYPLVLDDDALPEALFYSDKKSIERTSGHGDLRKRFDTKESFLLITRDWRLVEEEILPKEYTLIVKDRDKVLILKK